MARSMAGVVCVMLVFCFVVVPISCLAKDYTVGDAGGWSMNVDYSTWASDKTFAVGDTLVFNSGGGHTVDEVSETDYTSCTVGNSLTSDSSGVSSIILSTPGTHYFICGVMGHCDSGMKLAVTVASDDQTPPATSTTTPPLLRTPASTTPLVPTPPAASTTTPTLPSPLPTPGSTAKTLPSSPLPSSTSSPSALILGAPTPLLAPPTTTSTLSTAATTPTTTTTNDHAPPFAEASSTSTNTPTLSLFLIGMTLSRLFLY